MPTFSVNKFDVIELAFGQVYQSQRCLNILHYQYVKDAAIADGDQALFDLAGIVAINAGGIGDKIRDFQVDGVIWDFCRASIVAPTRLRYIHRPLNLSGAVASGGAPANVAAVVTKQSTIAGRGRSGRMSLTGVPLNTLVGGAMSGAAITHLNELGAKLHLKQPAGAVLDAYEPVLWRPTAVGVLPRVANAFAQPTSRVVRRRTVGQGV